MAASKRKVRRQVSLVLGGGVGLGAYQAGAYEALHDRDLPPEWLAGSSVGGVNAALIAGNAPDDRIERLREFWSGGAWAIPAPASVGIAGPLRHAENWMSVLHARIFGVSGHFRPRFSAAPFEGFASLYDLSPMRARLATLIDFDRLNGSGPRVSINTTDLETGDMVVFDTEQGARIEVAHLMASCGYLPEFAPVEIGGRLLGDGGLSANAPAEIVIGGHAPSEEHIVFVLDLFARDGERPSGLESALARKNDLMFGK